jgi:2-dehydro-3-deoxyphosphogalactonate aldolase
MEDSMTFEDAFAALPLIAILRGVRPDEVEAIAEALHKAGIGIVEVPLNSPEPLESIARLSRAFADRMVCGAGTVRTPAEVDAIAEAGGRIIVSPHVPRAVIEQSIQRGLVPIPGFFSPTEAFAAIDAGARHLKLFPASTAGPGHLSAIGAVLPAQVQVIAVGGVGPADMGAWRAAGAHGFGLGSDLYKPGRTAEQVFERAVAAVEAFRAAGEK